jgi:hypothetical protein
LKCQIKEETDLFIIDEVGKMELFSSAFFPAVMRVIESNIPVLATMPIPRNGQDIPGGTLLSRFATLQRLRIDVVAVLYKVLHKIQSPWLPLTVISFMYLRKLHSCTYLELANSANYTCYANKLIDLILKYYSKIIFKFSCKF